MRSLDLTYELCSWPALPGFGEPPPIESAALLATVSDRTPVRRLLETIALQRDLWIFLTLQAGADSPQRPVVLDDQQLRGEAPLPAQFAGELGPWTKERADGIWFSYFDMLERSGIEAGSRFVARLARFEREIAVASANARAARRGGAAVYEDGATGEDERTAREAVVGWTASEEPLSGWLGLQRSRWDWLDGNAHWFEFDLDEASAYLCRLLTLESVWTVSRGGKEGLAETEG